MSARRPRLVDLFCGGGGAGAGYHAAGFDVTGVDIAAQPDYPFPFHQADVLGLDPAWLAGFDVIHASPPCQAHSIATPPDRRHAHPDLVAPVRELATAALAVPAGRAWAYVIENVPGAPLTDPVTVCGDSLRLGVRRHRLFESNLSLAGTPCWHDRAGPVVPVYGSYGQQPTRRRNPIELGSETSPHPAGGGVERARAAMGIDWLPWPALTQAIPPTYTHWLAVQLHTHRPPQPPASVTNAAGGIRHHHDGDLVGCVHPPAGGDTALPLRPTTTPPARYRALAPALLPRLPPSRLPRPPPQRQTGGHAMNHHHQTADYLPLSVDHPDVVRAMAVLDQLDDHRRRECLRTVYRYVYAYRRDRNPNLLIELINSLHASIVINADPGYHQAIAELDKRKKSSTGRTVDVRDLLAEHHQRRQPGQGHP